MGSPRASHSSQRDFFFSIPFQYVFHNGAFPPEARDEIVFHRNAEVLIPQRLSLEPFLKFIACRSAAERQTLLHLLPNDVGRKWESKIRLGEQGFFERKWTYVEEVVVIDREVIKFRFNPSRELSSPFHVRVEYREQNHPLPMLWETQVAQIADVPPLRFRDATRGEIRLYLDDALAFSDLVFFDDIPF